MKIKNNFLVFSFIISCLLCNKSASAQHNDLDLPPVQGEETYTAAPVKKEIKSNFNKSMSAKKLATPAHKVEAKEEKQPAEQSHGEHAKEPVKEAPPQSHTEHATEQHAKENKSTSNEHEPATTATEKQSGEEVSGEETGEETSSEGASKGEETHEAKAAPDHNKLLEGTGLPAIEHQGTGLIWFGAVFVCLLLLFFIFV